MIENYIQDRRTGKDILLMTHIVLGYPSMEDSFRIIEAMVEAGVDLMELQIPFSEPTADGPVIARVNQTVLDAGVKVDACLDLAGKASSTFGIPFLIMTYYNIPFTYGVDRFTSVMRKNGLQGAIIPDLPPEEGREYLEKMRELDLDPVLIFSPTTSPERMNFLAAFAGGFIYCVARKGVTGQDTDFSQELAAYLTRCRGATSLPLAVGFGLKDKKDVDFLKGKADIAVVGSQTIRVMENGGIAAVGKFIRGLR